MKKAMSKLKKINNHIKTIEFVYEGWFAIFHISIIWFIGILVIWEIIRLITG